ncbi:MAG: heme-binding domain-containing protein [Flavobacteriaceae bacterium]|nr:heme-binding domain-containing protein [Flavobacteriaceae bacterium]
MKIFKIIARVLLVAFVGIQFIPTIRNQSKTVPKTEFMMIYNIPNNIKKKLQGPCYDCYSNNTAYPWYNKIQPVAWFLENHIKDGKKELNFNEWGDYSNRRKKSKLKSIISQIKGDKMPLWSYTLIHGDAKLSEKEKKEIIELITQIRDSI